MQHELRIAALAALAAAAGCASPPREEVRIVEVREMPVAWAEGVPGPGIPPAGTTHVRDDPAAEAARRAWLDEHYGAGRGAAARTEVRYVPQPEVVRERVVVVERRDDPIRWWVPPVTVGLSYWGGSRRHHRGHWGWDAGWGWGWPHGCR